ncbi:CbtA family protein [Amycolatopsis albispora]|uniref:Cobalt transporter n=1 Tax=Amycolatopsis albispora TaxID=1804986 RepID=A0A344LJB0_9PSEU|nr:CbtA family protein [Amycolatopsis albispora]AXB48134.1 hypothetical protein A4R43_41585 [Amycolatopsis albispora]
MMRTLLVRGLLAGLAAGVLAAVFAFFAGEPPIDAAIGIEESGTAAHAHSPAEAGGHAHGEEEELVSRDVQSTLGLLVGVGAYAVAGGGLFALAFAFCYGRLGSLRPRVLSALLAVTAFIVVVGVPFLKYPANPPAVGQGETIGDRTALYFGFVALSLAFAISAAMLGRRVGGWNGGLAGAGAYLVLVSVTAALMPSIDEVPDGFPGSTLWTFRIASLGTQLVLWVALGLIFGALAERVLTDRRARLAR